ncbi:MAG: hypothetical protein NVV70_06180 [Cellulomonas sp.]|uniref:Uncharacterized protein n=1 Tax=Cellulomonas gelida TaxID=1712 RepID=A0A4Y3KK36_9CELL|nr:MULTISPECIES: hypothetical protein [Cellulomonas]KMM46513.1 hypothetical protein CWIS_05105 [Cellulomonas sp. A375-1]MCR6647733.1 hypothetical protein [Cellulomonas sp.]MCR6703723.1 hypothetical protein [Cellulomonas sp.]GEA84382.1 hypothetical protein CGE01nite_16330 [Cellulomonas gelida]GGL26259.1 hypothetical protein GCM10009774_15860 [Cellulomonas gelida]
MTLTTGATVTLDDLQYTVQIRSVAAELVLLPGVNRVEVAIAAGVDVPASTGARASVELDGGDGAAVVITGTVDHVAHTTTGAVVVVTDAGAALAAARPAETYNGLTGVQVVGKLADLASADTGPVAALTQTAAYVADPRRTAAEHVAAIAARSDAVAVVDAEGRVTVVAWPVGVPTAAMRLDREFTSFTTSNHTPGHDFTPVGAGGSGAALSPDVWVPSTEAVTGADDPDGSRTWTPDPVLRTRTDVDLAARGATSRRAASTARMRATCWLQPARRPGDVVRIDETTDSAQAGPWLLTSVRHELAPRLARTTLVGVAAGASDDLLGGLLGGLAGGLGGLL